MMVTRENITSSILILTTYFILTSPCFALTINEVYPAPSNDEPEWVEVYNETNTSVDLSTFSLVDATGKQITFETNSVNPGEFALAQSKNVLNNSGDTVTLKTADGTTVESISYPDNFNDKKSYARCPDGTGSFAITEIVTKKGSNGKVCNVSATQPPEATGAQAITETPPSPVSSAETVAISYNGVYLSEAMVYPESESTEWVEVYNNNDFSVTLSNWYLDDIENGGSSPKIFSLTLNPKSYGVVNLSSSIFNNSADSVRLLDFNMVLKDSFSYTEALSGKTIGKTNVFNSSVCFQEPTKGTTNNSCIAASTTQSTNSTSAQAATKTPTNSAKTSTITQNPETKTKITTLSTKKIGILFNQIPTTKPLVSNEASQGGEILGVTNNIGSGNRLINITKAFAASSYFVSLLNISFLLHKIKHKLKVLK